MGTWAPRCVAVAVLAWAVLNMSIAGGSKERLRVSDSSAASSLVFDSSTLRVTPDASPVVSFVEDGVVTRAATIALSDPAVGKGARAYSLMAENAVFDGAVDARALTVRGVPVLTQPNAQRLREDVLVLAFVGSAFGFLAGALALGLVRRLRLRAYLARQARSGVGGPYRAEGRSP